MPQMNTWTQLPQFDRKEVAPTNIQQAVARSAVLPKSNTKVFALFASKIVRGDELLLAACRVQRIRLNRGDGTHEMIGPGGRGAPVPLLLLTNTRLVVARFHMELRSKDSYWLWTEIPLSSLGSVSAVHSGRFEIEMPLMNITAQLVFELWALRLATIRSIRDSVAAAVSRRA